MRLKYMMILAAGVFLCSCHKDDGGLSASSLTGLWTYQNSTVDTLRDGKWTDPVTAYDDNFAVNVGEVLEFRKPDTVFFYTGGSRTWCNYAVKGNSLILIGAVYRDTLAIHSLTNSALQIGWDRSTDRYWANFSKQ